MKKWINDIRKDAKKEGKAAGIVEGTAAGILKAYIDLVKDKIVSIVDAANRLGMPEDKLAAMIK